MLEISALHAYYGRAHILEDVSFSVGWGEVVALLGRNGAGKSTTLKSIMGLVPPAKGWISFDGHNLVGRTPYAIARLGLGYVPEERRVFPELTVAELRTRQAGRISGGEQQMLTIARTLMGNPRAILLDEPSEGLAPVIVEQMARTIEELKQEGLTVLLSEQNLRFASLIANRALIIEQGRIRYQGTLAELEADEEVRAAYLMV
jgi:branched-chain amino acid transport system ATP-binding protein